jgi:hypothetical protein
LNTTRRTLLLAWLLLLASAAPGAAQSQERGDWRGTGVVLALLPPPSSLHPELPVIIIRHEPIAGLMDERMAMPFVAASTTLFQGLQPGDRVRFELKNTPDALLVVVVERLGPSQ